MLRCTLFGFLRKLLFDEPKICVKILYPSLAYPSLFSFANDHRLLINANAEYIDIIRIRRVQSFSKSSRCNESERRGEAHAFDELDVILILIIVDCFTSLILHDAAALLRIDDSGKCFRTPLGKLTLFEQSALFKVKKIKVLRLPQLKYI